MELNINELNKLLEAASAGKITNIDKIRIGYGNLQKGNKAK